MIIAFDVGNTETTIGLFDGDRLEAHWRTVTESQRTPDEYGLMLRGLLSAAGIDRERIAASIIGSVVPPVTAPLEEACVNWLKAPASIIDANSPLPIKLQVDEPLTVGADRIINTLAASRQYHRDTIVVDLGTATTFDCITGSGIFLGGVIAPGVLTSAETLVRKTSKLPATELAAPPHVIGTRTEDCIRSGVLFGAVDSIDGIVRRIKREWPTSADPLVIATGGLASVIASLAEEIDRVDPHLTLHGLRIAYGLLSAGKA